MVIKKWSTRGYSYAKKYTGQKTPTQKPPWFKPHIRNPVNSQFDLKYKIAFLFTINIISFARVWTPYRCGLSIWSRWHTSVPLCFCCTITVGESVINWSIFMSICILGVMKGSRATVVFFCPFFKAFLYKQKNIAKHQLFFYFLNEVIYRQSPIFSLITKSTF